MTRQPLEPLTWLRGFAAFFVVVHHCFYTASVAYGINDIPAYFSPLNFLDLGTFAVALFFALSGCTLALNYFAKIQTLKNYGCYVLKRFMRIWPAFAVSLLLCLGFKVIFKYFYIGPRDCWIAYLLDDYSILNIFQYLSLTFNITGPRGLFFNVYWTLPVEFQYYLLLPLALVLMRNAWAQLLVPLLFGGLGYFIYQRHLFAFENPAIFKMAYIFFGGVLVARWRAKSNARVPLPVAASLFWLLILVLGALRNEILIIPSQLPFVSDLANVYGVCALGLVALGAFTQAPSQPQKSLNFLRHYGEISYSIYLFHIFFVGTAALLVVNLHIFGGIIKLLFLLSFALVGVYFWARLSHKYLELPAIAWGRRLTQPQPAGASVRAKN